MLLTTWHVRARSPPPWRSRAPSPLSDGGSRTMPVVNLLPPPVPEPRRRAVSPAQANHLPLDPRVSRLTAVSRARAPARMAPTPEQSLGQTFEIRHLRAPLRNRTVDLLLTIEILTNVKLPG